MRNIMKKTILLMLGSVSLSGCASKESMKTSNYNPDIQPKMIARQFRRDPENEALQRKRRGEVNRSQGSTQDLVPPSTQAWEPNSEHTRKAVEAIKAPYQKLGKTPSS